MGKKEGYSVHIHNAHVTVSSAGCYGNAAPDKLRYQINVYFISHKGAQTYTILNTLTPNY